MRRKAAIFVALLFSFASMWAQTDYDIRVFLDNVPEERPKKEDLNFYLLSGKKLLKEGRISEANILFDYAASLGSADGFAGKAMSEDGPMRARHLLFAHKQTAACRKLLRAMSRADYDLKAALLVHDNISWLELNYIEDPLVRWMPSVSKDTLYLKKHDNLAFEIAELKEKAGYKMDAIFLYEIAAKEGNFEAMEKVRDVGFEDKEMKLKDVLISWMRKEEPAVSLHKYFTGEALTAKEYAQVSDSMTDDNEFLISMALGIHEPEVMSYKDQIINALVLSIRSRQKESLTNFRNDYYYDRIKSAGSSFEQQLFIRKQTEFSKTMKKDDEELDKATMMVKGKYNESSVEEQLSSLQKYCQHMRDHVFSADAVSFIEHYYETNPSSWSGQVVEMVKGLRVSEDIPREIHGNPLFPVYNSKLFEKMHHTSNRTPKQVVIEL